MAISPTDKNDVFIREVDDAVREDQIKSFWDRFGKLVLGALVVGLLGYGGWLFYNHSNKQAAAQTAETFVGALDDLQAGKEAAGTKALAGIKADGDDAYRAAAILTEANVVASKGDDAKAGKLLGDLAADAKAPQFYRDIALVKQTTLQFDTIKPQDVVTRMKPLAVETNAVFPSAAELLALAHMKLGQDKEAGALFGKIAGHEASPEGLKSRAQQMAGMLGVDAVKQPAAMADTKAAAKAASGEAK